MRSSLLAIALVLSAPVYAQDAGDVPSKDAKADADKFVAESGLDYTVVRPGGLTDDPGTGKVSVGDDLPGGSVSRDDVALVVAEALRADNTIGKAFDLVGGETPVAEAIAASCQMPPARAVREAAVEKQILRVYKDSGERYGAWKVWDQLNREGIAAARCTVERLMRTLGLRGVRRGGYKKVRTTHSDPSQQRPADLVNRDFAPPRRTALKRSPSATRCATGWPATSRRTRCSRCSCWWCHSGRRS